MDGFQIPHRSSTASHCSLQQALIFTPLLKKCPVSRLMLSVLPKCALPQLSVGIEGEVHLLSTAPSFGPLLRVTDRPKTCQSQICPD